MTAESRIKQIQRDMLASSKLWGSTCENAIRSGARDEGSLIADFQNEAEQDALKHQIEEIADD